METCQNPECENQFEPKQNTQKFCSEACKGKAYRLAQKAKPMNGLSTHDTPDIRVEEVEGFDFKNPLQASFVEARNAARQYKTLHDRERETRINLERKNDKLEDKIERITESHAVKIEALQKDHKYEIEKITQEWERRLGDSEKSNSLSGVAREVLTPDVVKELGPGLIQGIFATMNKGQQGTAYPQPVKKVADLLVQAYPEEQEKVLVLIQSIVNASGENVEQYLDTLITQINTQTHGTSSN